MDQTIWITQAPLAGKRIVVTRAPEQAGELTGSLERLGAEVLLSAHGGIRRSGKLGSAGRGDRPPRRIRLDFIHQPECGALLRSCGSANWRNSGDSSAGSKPRMSPSWARQRSKQPCAEGFHVDYAAQNQHRGIARPRACGDRLAIATCCCLAATARTTGLPDALREAGARVTDVVAYRTAAPEKVDAAILGRLRRGEVDAIVFASPSAFHNLCDFIPAADLAKLSGASAIRGDRAHDGARVARIRHARGNRSERIVFRGACGRHRQALSAPAPHGAGRS